MVYIVLDWIDLFVFQLQNFFMLSYWFHSSLICLIPLYKNEITTDFPVA